MAERAGRSVKTMTDPTKTGQAEPDPGAQTEAEGDRDDIRPQDQGKGPGTDPSDRPPAEGERDDAE